MQPSEGNQSPLVERENAKVNHRKGEIADISEREEGEFPRENGENQTNGTRTGIDSDRNADRHPDVMDDHPSKSRSIFLPFMCFCVCMLITPPPPPQLLMYLNSHWQESKHKP